jgi:hypothetical protein
VVRVPRNLAEASLRIPTPGERLRAIAGKPFGENATWVALPLKIRFTLLAPLQEKDQHREGGDPENRL